MATIEPATQMATQRWRDGGVEPPLEELLSDPIMAILLDHDRLTRDDVLAVIREALRLGPPAKAA